MKKNPEWAGVKKLFPNFIRMSRNISLIILSDSVPSWLLWWQSLQFKNPFLLFIISVIIFSDIVQKLDIHPEILTF